MKKIYIILLLAVMLIQSGSRLWILGMFYINQSYIAASLCVNRFEAIPVCKGSCYLEKQLNKHDEEQQKFPDLKVRKITMYCNQQVIDLLQEPSVVISIKKYFLTANYFIPEGFSASVFRPPSTFV